MHRDVERCYRAVQSRDQRFDGWFFTAVTTTRIYCRPSCPARTPRRENTLFFASAAAAQQAGFRACKRCRPDASPGSPEWNSRRDVVGRAMRLIADGAVDRDGVGGLAAQLGYSARQVERHLRTELGAGPLALARAQRSQTARLLIETTDLPFAEVAFAAGFTSIRQFNDTVREVFDATPTQLRFGATAAPATVGTGAALLVRLPFRPPLHAASLFGHLAATAVPGCEEVRDGAFRRTVRLPAGAGVVSLVPRESHVECRLRLDDVRDVGVAISRVRRLLDLDADPDAVSSTLGSDELLGPLIATCPGCRIPGSVDGDELAIRVVMGQQVTIRAARTAVAKLVARLGTPIADPDGALTHLFPTTAELAERGPGSFEGPGARRTCLARLACTLAEGEIDLGAGADPERVRSHLTSLPGIGEWTVEMIAMRGLGDPDAFPAGDLGVRKAAACRGLPSTRAALISHAHRWRPWRSYAVQCLWATLDHPVNEWPPPSSGTAC